MVVPSGVSLAKILALLRGNQVRQRQRRAYEQDGADGGKPTEEIVHALLLTENLLGTARDGTGQTCALTGLEEDRCDQTYREDHVQDRQQNLHVRFTPRRTQDAKISFVIVS